MRLGRHGLLSSSACALLLAHGCAGTSPPPEHAEAEEIAALTTPTGPIEIPLPAESTAARDNRRVPVLQVLTTSNVVYPTVYGYPIYPEGDAAQGLYMLRRDNWSSVRRKESTDSEGVVHESEEYPQLGCQIDGVRENVNRFVPLSLTCELPPPKQLGGAKRPVFGSLMSGAKADQLLKDRSVEEIFLGAFHLTSGDFQGGSGEGFFNTTHGQLAFGFSKKKLTRFVYYFDPTVQAWQNPTLWGKP
jgi:hypothetical protein